jgi:hypothetical protein
MVRWAAAGEERPEKRGGNPVRSPAEMKVIQIEVTNACAHSCSNCTRFCGQHPKPFFMELDTFRKAVDSLQGFKGIVGIIGGEPTLHPQFDQLLDYYAPKVPEPRPYSFIRQPVKAFHEYARMVKYQRGRRRGLFSSLGAGYYRHFEQIQDTFPYQSINDHSSVNTHQAILITRKELGIPDEEWLALRDKCWIQNLWSASITPKGAFFCEIAGSLDMLFDGPGGWPIEPGWWKRKPKDFADQLHWCEMCSVALKVPALEATREADILSPAILEKLQKISGPKMRKGDFVVFDPTGYDSGQYSGHQANPIWYLPQDQGDAARVSPTNNTLYPRRVDVAVLEGESPRSTLSPGKLAQLDFTDWVVAFRNAAAVNDEFLAQVSRCVLNPGCLYHYGGSVFLFNRRARALRGLNAIRLDGGLPGLWERKKRVRLAHYPSIGELSMWEKLSLAVKRIGNRCRFLVPVPTWGLMTASNQRGDRG